MHSAKNRRPLLDKSQVNTNQKDDDQNQYKDHSSKTKVINVPSSQNWKKKHDSSSALFTPFSSNIAEIQSMQESKREIEIKQ